MKIQNLILVAAALTFTACNKTTMQDQVKPVETTEAAAHEHNHEDGHDHSHEGEEATHESHSAKELSLNNGQKWKLDESTKTHGATLTRLAEKFDQEKPQNLTAYQTFGKNVDASLQELIKACTMKGPDHDALHLWLEPVLEGANKLKNNTDEASAKTEAEALSKNIQKFNQFFS